MFSKLSLLSLLGLSATLVSAQVEQCSGTPAGISYNGTDLSTDSRTSIDPQSVLSAFIYINGHGNSCEQIFALGVVKDDGEVSGQVPTNAFTGFVGQTTINGGAFIEGVIDGIQCGNYTVYQVQYDSKSGDIVGNPWNSAQIYYNETAYCAENGGPK